MHRAALILTVWMMLPIAGAGARAQPKTAVPDGQQTLNKLIARAQDDLSSPSKRNDLTETLAAISELMPQATPDQTRSILLLLAKIKEHATPAPKAPGAAVVRPAPHAGTGAVAAEGAAQKSIATPSPETLAMFQRGADAEHTGNISDARRFYQAAAAAGYSKADIAVGRLYDPTYLSQIGIIGGQFSDPALARQWYERAAAQGDPQAQSLISNLPR